MTDKQALARLLRAESILKQTLEGYAPDRPRWRVAMPMLWSVREALADPHGLMLAEAHGLLKKTEHGYNPHASRWRQAMSLIDQVESDLHRPPVPDLGPVIKGDKSVLLWTPTHETSGLRKVTGSPYPAFDSAFGQVGKSVIAPERLYVRRQSSAVGADAFYATGVSGIEWWFGHLASSPATGSWFNKGERMSSVARIPQSDGGPHLHTGMDTRKLGRDLQWGKNGDGPDYTFGSPTIGKQLERMLA